MSPSQIISSVLLGTISLAALSIILAPQSHIADVIKAFMGSYGDLLTAAKKTP